MDMEQRQTKTKTGFSEARKVGGASTVRPKQVTFDDKVEYVNQLAVIDTDPPETEARAAMSHSVKYRPTEEEVREHELTHIPYRSWCEHCVKGKAQQLPDMHGHQQGHTPGHLTQPEDPLSLPHANAPLRWCLKTRYR